MSLKKSFAFSFYSIFLLSPTLFSLGFNLESFFLCFLFYSLSSESLSSESLSSESLSHSNQSFSSPASPLSFISSSFSSSYCSKALDRLPWFGTSLSCIYRSYASRLKVPSSGRSARFETSMTFTMSSKEHEATSVLQCDKVTFCM